MAASRDYYEILGVARTASEDEIRSAYRKLARKYHPDVNKDPDAAKRFSEVTEAYDVLVDPEKRRDYDRFGRTGVGAGHGPGAGRRTRTTWRSAGPGGVGGFGEDVSAEDFSDIFEQVFGGGSPFGRGPGVGRTAQAQPRPRKGQNIRHTLSISFLTAALGGTEQLRLGGTATDDKPETIDIKIPAGIDSGAKLRVKGKGQPGIMGGPRGDLILTVDVGQHPYFRREGLDLYVDVPITIAEAALGTSVTVPLLRGSVQIKIAPGTSSGRKLRVKGKGIVDAKGKAGDFYAVVQIVAPKDLSEHSRKALEEIARELENPRAGGPMADTV